MWNSLCMVEWYQKIATVDRLEFNTPAWVENVDEGGAELRAAETVDDEVDGGTERQQSITELSHALRQLVSFVHVADTEHHGHDGVR